MLKDFSRSMRLERSLYKEIAVIIQKNLRDPRLNSFITITEVKLSYDLSYAKVFITFLNYDDKKNIKIILGILQNATGYIRSLLNKKIYLRIVPKLFFVYDTSLINGIFISELIKNI
ncbi:30S ribosome-binding factor RbfA [Buchnera aphidicola]|uniref:Ribosome-binding factor A n=1 Tax=Buchnera aphidicola subsp. Cinara cedri (strain Cc) TaxID=372461 RepID=RBFA_BUCCC|nr:30S ribosome-binding factor RbfA [Buchnera aphidicola]Q057K0.1 RecName: Full=Ribosome-binding factor A [Buchnera aphidicola BCc]ABJ90699.1 ribosome-binding factor A [Buchnera aphidicola BCc]